VRGKTTATSDVKHLVLEWAFDVRELKFFAESDFDVRNFKANLSDALATDEFTATRSAFGALMGAESPRASHLQHTRQSAKNMGDLNVEQSESSTTRLTRCARGPAPSREPALAAHAERETLQGQCNQLDALRVNFERFCAQRKKALLEDDSRVQRA